MRKSLVLCLSLLLPLAACGDDGPTDPTQSAVGTYTLVQVNGSPLPAFLGQSGGLRIEILSGTMTLRSNKSYTDSENRRRTSAGGVAETYQFIEEGTFTVTGSTVQFHASNGPRYSGTLRGKFLEFTAAGINAKYEKQ